MSELFGVRSVESGLSVVEIGRYRDKLPTRLDNKVKKKEMKGEDLRGKEAAQIIDESKNSVP